MCLFILLHEEHSVNGDAPKIDSTSLWIKRRKAPKMVIIIIITPLLDEQPSINVAGLKERT